MSNLNKSFSNMKHTLLFFAIIAFPTLIFAQTDSLTFKNGNRIDGEIKSMDRGVLQMETDYSDSDFKIEWEQINTIKTVTTFLINLTDGSKYYGTIKSRAASQVTITTADQGERVCDLNDIVFLQSIEKGFWDRLYAAVDVGFSHTKANDLRQFTSRSNIGYRTEQWTLDATYNMFRSTQQETEPINRGDGKLSYWYNLPRRWYAVTTALVASNTEQKLDLRLNAQIGLGRFLVRSNSAYWGVKLGVNRNVERFSNEAVDRNTWEGYVGTELNLYDIGDLSLLSSIIIYTGITEQNRLRGDFNFDTKYYIPYDFYIKIVLTINYDNQPAEGASESDYVFHTGLGWEW
jgi:hypothetical protein